MTRYRTNKDGLELVLACIQDQQEFPTAYGVKSFLANHLGVTRQTILNWEERDGVPREQLRAVCKLTGLSEMEVRPEDVSSHIPGDLYDRIVKRALRLRSSFSDMVVASLRKDYR